ncbi:MAG: hypothetical protein D8M57_06040 [Candidatus Scalindua sp. AMX11]|nr:MAG: hypothetical protein DWQ00_12995 [Candidatus Scalindua sp.]NOG82900.1 hypothetical protein [Planctomycetota bacterium]RZV86240.1 MAG: hypothetical protein EX341_07705 [Candidatus Scalindua sp. SCAELEC01]TDE65862.1 MAG: hypothetical protein D8M57_06040 [Candidatus Scalindua sp. AMX11]GJQ60298.1 MAG: hypothetical protein SCALA701_30990 [Candidatus Scalindua sp.]
MPVKVKKRTGQLPEFWDRSIIFFANVLSIFFENCGEVESLKEEIEGLETYGGRLIPIIDILFRGENNLLVLEKSPDETLMSYFQKALGLSLPDIVIVPHSEYTTILPNVDKMSREEITSSLTSICQHEAAWIDGFVSDSVLIQVAKALNKLTISSLEGSKKGNNKYLLHYYLSEKGYPVFDTFSASSPGDVSSCVTMLRNKGYQEVVVKAQIGASGIGMIKLSTASFRTQDIPEHIFFEGPCMVQGWLDGTTENVCHLGSPSVQMFLDDETVTLYDITEQILSEDSIHEGNLSPPPYFSPGDCVYEELMRQSTSAAAWLHDQGYRGTASIDFLVVDRLGNIEVRACEINARVTGATYPSVLARHFMPHGAWVMRNLRFILPLRDTSILAILEESGKLYHPGLKRGIMPVNFNLDEKSGIQKGQFLCLGRDPEDCLRLFKEIESILPVRWFTDRD